MRLEAPLVLAALLCAAAVACSGASRGATDSPVRADSPVVQAPSGPPPTAATATAPGAAPAVAANTAQLAEPPAVAAAPGAPSPVPPTAAATEPTAPTPEQARVAQVLHYDDKDPLADLEQADELDRSAGKIHTVDVTPPARGCAVQSEPRRLWSAPGIASVAAIGGGFVIAGYAQADHAERLFILHLHVSGLAEPIATLRVEPPHPTPRVAPPGLAAELSQGATLAYTDGAGVLFMQHVQVGSAHGGAARTELAKGVDTRFAPAVAYGKRGPLIAYTLGTTPMRTRLLRLGARGELLTTHDVTPTAMGAAAPAFVAGAVPPVLVTADARNGMSPIARIPLAQDGQPAPGQATIPVGMMSTPAQLTAAQASFGAFVGYTGLGSAATSAVGLLQLTPKPGAPSALVKGTAYGPLHVAAVASRNALVFAADAPLGPGKAPAHEIQLTRIDAQGPGSVLHIPGPGGDATCVSLARGDDGRIAVVFTGKDGVYLATVRCEP